jgi:uncharacterized BrkB/YihY/UPF0761 family membrane protein
MILALSKSTVLWVIFNVIGIIVWLCVGSIVWPNHGIEGCAPDGPDGLAFVAIVIPFTCVVLIANITAIIAVSLNVDRRRNPLLVLAIVATTIIWLGAVAFDYYMTTRPVTGQCP